MAHRAVSRDQPYIDSEPLVLSTEPIPSAAPLVVATRVRGATHISRLLSSFCSSSPTGPFDCLRPAHTCYHRSSFTSPILQLLSPSADDCPRLTSIEFDPSVCCPPFGNTVCLSPFPEFLCGPWSDLGPTVFVIPSSFSLSKLCKTRVMVRNLTTNQALSPFSR